MAASPTPQRDPAPQAPETIKPEPAKPEPAAALKPATGTVLRRTSSISIKREQPAAAAAAASQVSAPPLDEASLQRIWSEYVAQVPPSDENLTAALKDRIVKLADKEDFFLIEVPSNYTAAQIRPHIVDMLQYMRHASGRQQLNCDFELVAVEQETVIYMPEDKYEAMLQANPALRAFRSHFPDIDY